MFSVNAEKCIGCGLCVKDCFPRDIEMVDGKAKINNVTCMKCGHCIAVCPKAAVSTDDYDMNEVKEFSSDDFSLSSDNLLNFIKYRRTIRQFKDKEVEEDKLIKIIEAGRFTQTGSNLQDVSYTVIRGENLKTLKDMTFESLKVIGENMLNDPSPEMSRYKRYAKMWLDMYANYKQDPKNDKIFFNAPSVIVVTANSDVSGALASSNMELMTNALGLGTFFSGFFVRASQNSKEILDFLNIEPGKQVVTCMIVGYPSVTYKRTVPRKSASITWK